jgi:hypothetical protein
MAAENHATSLIKKGQEIMHALPTDDAALCHRLAGKNQFANRENFFKDNIVSDALKVKGEERIRQWYKEKQAPSRDTHEDGESRRIRLRAEEKARESASHKTSWF